MELNLVITIVIELVGVAVMFGICKQKIADNEREIKELKDQFRHDLDAINNRQNATDNVLQSIKDSLSGLNSKMDLILDGKIKIN